MPPPLPAAPPFAPCKVCGHPSPIYGVVDFYQTCAVLRPVPQLGWSGIPIYYHRCGNCDFLFTIAFDQFTTQDFSKWVYNDQYVHADPEYYDARPKRNADWIDGLFHHDRKNMTILDYGCGAGLFTGMLRERGFNIDGYDPFVPEFSTPPRKTYDLVIAFEVVEHSTKPKFVLADMCRFMSHGGMVLFTTQIQPEDFDEQRLNWFYVAPRNGHVSIHSLKSLTLLAKLLNMSHAIHTEINTLFGATPPRFARKMFDRNIEWTEDIG